MDRKIFDKLSVENQVNYINSELQNNISLRKISDSLHIQRKTIRLRFRKVGFDFDMEQNRYISNKISNEEINKEYECNTNVIQDDEVGSKTEEEYKCNTNVFKSETTHEIKGEYTLNTNVFRKEDDVIKDINTPQNNKGSCKKSENSKKLDRKNKKNNLIAEQSSNKKKVTEGDRQNTKVIQSNTVGSESKEEYKSNTNVFKGETPHEIKGEYTQNTNVIQSNKVESKSGGEKEEYKSNIVVFNDSIKEGLMNLAAVKGDIFKVIEWFNKKQREENIIDVPELKINKNKFDDEVKITTIRLYSNVKEDFKEFIKKYPEYKSQDIYSQALLEFMDKYNK